MLYRYVLDKNGKLLKKAVIYTKNEHSIESGKIDIDAKRTISYLQQHGYRAYIVGGAVRDLLLKKTPKDFDIVTDATPSQIKRLFRNSRVIGKRFRLVHIFFDQKLFEVSTFRSLEGGTVGNEFGTIDDDALRRDFTLNALYYDPETEQIIDYVGGIKDIAKKRMKPVIPLDTIFVEDPVRMIRAVKYAATTGFTMPYSLKRKIKQNASLLASVSPSRITEELMKIINSGHSFEIMSYALQLRFFSYLQPSAEALMTANPEFERKYFARLQELDTSSRSATEMRIGEKLSFLLIDFISSSIALWKHELQTESFAEIYALTWAHCRKFILPMNPPRVELDFAVRSALKRLGVAFAETKKIRSRRRPSTDERQFNKLAQVSVSAAH